MVENLFKNATLKIFQEEKVAGQKAIREKMLYPVELWSFDSPIGFEPITIRVKIEVSLIYGTRSFPSRTRTCDFHIKSVKL
jgi:hypothetical protein